MRCGRKLTKQQVSKFHCGASLLHGEEAVWGGGRQCRIGILWLTGVGGEQGAALAVDDLLDKWHILGEGCGHHTEAGHHGIQGGNSSHHTKVGIKIWRQERNLWMRSHSTSFMGKKVTATQQHLNTDLFPAANLWSAITSTHTKSLKFHFTLCTYSLSDSSVNISDTQAAYT